MSSDPILRWAGGKRWLVPQLPMVLNNIEFNDYHEPFVGGASVFLGMSIPGKAYLSDLNSDLMETYQQVRDCAGDVAESLGAHINTSEHYYRTRATMPITAIERAARFIYLNHTSFNGIYRVNLRGAYNVPFGKRSQPRLPTREQLFSVSSQLQGVDLNAGDFANCLVKVKPGDLVFLDPPYTVAHNHNGFVKYNQRLFSFDDQRRLSGLIDEIRNRKAFYVMTNAAHESIALLFEKGDTRLDTKRRNAVGGRAAVRGTADEYLFTNITI